MADTRYLASTYEWNADRIRECLDMIETLDFSASLRAIMRSNKIVQDQLIFVSGLAKGSVRKYLYDHQKSYTTRTVFLIIISLKLPFEISSKLLAKIGWYESEDRHLIPYWHILRNIDNYKCDDTKNYKRHKLYHCTSLMSRKVAQAIAKMVQKNELPLSRLK